MKWTCPDCGGVIESRSQAVLDKWVGAHKNDNCPRAAVRREK